MSWHGPCAALPGPCAPLARRPLIPNFAEDTDEADAIKRTFRDIIQDHARETSYLASYITLKPGAQTKCGGMVFPTHDEQHDGKHNGVRPAVLGLRRPQRGQQCACRAPGNVLAQR